MGIMPVFSLNIIQYMHYEDGNGLNKFTFNHLRKGMG